MTLPAAVITVVILGQGTIVDEILESVHRARGYDAKSVPGAAQGEAGDDPLEGVDVLLLAPGLSGERRCALLDELANVRHSTGKVVPLLRTPSLLKAALLDEQSTSVGWAELIEEVVRQFEALLGRSGVA